MLSETDISSTSRPRHLLGINIINTKCKATLSSNSFEPVEQLSPKIHGNILNKTNKVSKTNTEAMIEVKKTGAPPDDANITFIGQLKPSCVFLF